MENPKEQKNCAKNIALACSLLKMPLRSVRALFNEDDISEIYYSSKEEKDFGIDIQFDTIILACQFDVNKICVGVFLLFRNLVDIAYYLDFCNRMYSPDVVLNGWIGEGFLIQFQVVDNNSTLLILPIKRGGTRGLRDV